MVMMLMVTMMMIRMKIVTTIAITTTTIMVQFALLPIVSHAYYMMVKMTTTMITMIATEVSKATMTRTEMRMKMMSVMTALIHDNHNCSTHIPTQMERQVCRHCGT